MGKMKERMTLASKFSAVALALVLILTSSAALPSGPGDQIRQTIFEIHRVVNDAADAAPARRESLRQIVLPRFDWTEMARLVLGKHWAAHPERQAEFIAAFQNFLTNVYAGKIGELKDEKILFTHESVEADQAQVQTKIMPARGEPTIVQYRLHQVQDEWKIHDVVIDDISVIANYRSQFARILAKGSFDDLLNQLRAK